MEPLTFTFMPLLGVAIVPLIWAASAIIPTVLMVYDMVREQPDKKMADYLTALQTEKLQTAQTEVKALEASQEDFAQDIGQLRGQQLSSMQEDQMSFDTATDSLLATVAARIGMDPRELASRLNPSRSGWFTPRDQSGEAPRPTVQELFANSLSGGQPTPIGAPMDAQPVQEREPTPMPLGPTPMSSGIEGAGQPVLSPPNMADPRRSK